jgi:hypothetical protein
MQLKLKVKPTQVGQALYYEAGLNKSCLSQKITGIIILI